MIRVVLPHHLRTLAKVGDEVHIDLNGSPTVKAILDELETKFPMLRGTRLGRLDAADSIKKTGL